jgi:hypothetical protein
MGKSRATKNSLLGVVLTNKEGKEPQPAKSRLAGKATKPRHNHSDKKQKSHEEPQTPPCKPAKPNPVQVRHTLPFAFELVTHADIRAEEFVLGTQPALDLVASCAGDARLQEEKRKAAAAKAALQEELEHGAAQVDQELLDQLDTAAGEAIEANDAEAAGKALRAYVIHELVQVKSSR